MSATAFRLICVLSAAIVGAALFAGAAPATTSPSYPDYPQCLLRAIAPTHSPGASQARPRARVDGCGQYAELRNPEAGAAHGHLHRALHGLLVQVPTDVSPQIG